MRLTKEQIAKVCEIYKQGISCPKIAKEFNVSSVAIQGLLKRRNVPRRTQSQAQRKLFFDENAFDVITEESAYWIGFLMADGNVSHKHGSSPEISLTLCSKDKEHLLKFRSFLKSEHSLINVSKTNAIRFSIKSNTLANSLNIHNVVPCKSFAACASDVLMLNRHFWRGIIDGDGHLAISNKKKIILQLVGGKNVMEQFNQFVRIHVPNCQSSVRPHKSIYTVQLSCNMAFKIIEILYRDASVFLDRKYQQYLEIKEYYNRDRIKKCSICNEKHFGKGYCKFHWYHHAGGNEKRHDRYLRVRA